MSNDIEIKVKAKAEGGEEVQTLGTRMKELGTEMNGLQKTADDISSYEKYKKELQALTISLHESQLKAQQQKEAFGEGSSAYARAEAATESLKRKIDQQRTSLGELGASLRKSGVDTNSLTSEQNRLQKEISSTREAFIATKKVQDAYATLGIKSTAETNAEIKKLKDAYNLLRAAGNVANEDLKNAAAALKAKLKEVNEEQNRSKTGIDLSGRAALAASAGFAALGAAAIAAMKSTFDVMANAEKAGFALESSVKAANREFSNTGSLENWQGSISRLSDNLQIYSKSAITEAAAKTLDMTKRLGLSAEQMETVIRAAGDMGAGNFELSDSVERLTAALRGEAEASEALGLTLSEGYVSAWHAANNAHGKAWKDLTDLEKAQVRYQVMLEQTAASQGKAAASTGTFSGAMAAMKASVEDNIAKNPQLLESMTELGNIIRENGDTIAVFASGVATVTGFIVKRFSDMQRGVQIVFAGMDLMISNLSLGLLNLKLIWEKVFGSDENVKAVEAQISAEKRHQEAIIKTINDIANEGEQTKKTLEATGQKAEETGQKTQKAIEGTKEAAIDLKKAFEDLDKSEFFKGNITVDQFNSIAKAIRQEPIKALGELGSRLEKLSAEELKSFQDSFESSSKIIMGYSKESKAALEAVADVLLKKLGVDSKEVLTGIDSQFGDLIKNFDTLAKNAEVTGNELFAAFQKMRESANSTQEYQKLDGILKQLGESGKVSGEQIEYAYREMGTQAVKQLFDEIKKADDAFEFDKLKTDAESLYQSGIINAKQYGAALDQLKIQTEGTAEAVDDLARKTKEVAGEEAEHTEEVKKATKASEDEADALKEKAKALEDEAKLLKDSAKLQEQKAKAAESQYKADEAALEQAKNKLKVAEASGVATNSEINALKNQIEKLEAASASSRKLAIEQGNLADDTKRAADALLDQAAKAKQAADELENVKKTTYSVMDAGTVLGNSLKDLSNDIYRAVMGFEGLDSVVAGARTNALAFSKSLKDLDFSNSEDIKARLLDIEDLIGRTSSSSQSAIYRNVKALLEEADSISSLQNQYADLFNIISSGGAWSTSSLYSLNDEAEYAIRNMKYLDDERLENLKDSINEAKAVMEDFRDKALEAEKTLKEMTADFQDEFDRLSGNDTAIENRRFDAEVAKLKELYAVSGSLGKEEFDRNMELAEKIHQKKLAQIAERSAAEKVSSGSTPTAEDVPASIMRQIQQRQNSSDSGSGQSSSKSASRVVEVRFVIDDGSTVSGTFEESAAEKVLNQLKRARMVS